MGQETQRRQELGPDPVLASVQERGRDKFTRTQVSSQEAAQRCSSPHQGDGEGPDLGKGADGLFGEQMPWTYANGGPVGTCTNF